MPSPRPVCAGCGDRVGVYEPIWLETPDGGVHHTSLLALSGEDSTSPARVYYHLGCLPTDLVPEA
jgi:hypothetical protein